MAHKVRLTAPAEVDAYAAYERIREAAPLSAENGCESYIPPSKLLKICPRVVGSSLKQRNSPTTRDSCSMGNEAGFTASYSTFRKHPRNVLASVSLRIWHGARDIITVQDIEIEY